MSGCPQWRNRTQHEWLSTMKKPYIARVVVHNGKNRTLHEWLSTMKKPYTAWVVVHNEDVVHRMSAGPQPWRNCTLHEWSIIKKPYLTWVVVHNEENLADTRMVGKEETFLEKRGSTEWGPNTADIVRVLEPGWRMKTLRWGASPKRRQSLHLMRCQWRNISWQKSVVHNYQNLSLSISLSLSWKRN